MDKTHLNRNCLRFSVIKSVRGIQRLKSLRPPLNGKSENGNVESLGRMSNHEIVGGRFMHFGVPITQFIKSLPPVKCKDEKST